MRVNSPEGAAIILLFVVGVSIIFKALKKSEEEREAFFKNCEKGLVVLFFIGCLAILYSVYGR